MKHNQPAVTGEGNAPREKRISELRRKISLTPSERSEYAMLLANRAALYSRVDYRKVVLP